MQRSLLERTAEARLLNQKDKDPYSDVYDDVPVSLWKERSGEDDDYEEPLF